MKTFLNIRGPNGSGKTTLAKRFIGDHDATTGLFGYRDKKTGVHKITTGIINPERNSIVVGKYTQWGGGLDTIPTYESQHGSIRAALELPEVDLVIGEGIMASTQIGCWKPFSEELRAAGHRVIWAFLSTPLEVCLERIDGRRAAHGMRKRPFKTELVAEKWRKNESLYEELKDADWVEVVRLPFKQEWETLCDLLGLEK
jgi:energy-coupling factor transporter ATP-binding protein EcfA2